MQTTLFLEATCAATAGTACCITSGAILASLCPEAVQTTTRAIAEESKRTAEQTKRIPEESKRTPKEYQKNSKRIPKESLHLD
jgi:hypothetical protein